MEYEISKDYLIFLKNAKAPRNYYTDIKILKSCLRNKLSRLPCNEESSVSSSETDYIRFFNQLGLRGESVDDFVCELLFQDLVSMQFYTPSQWSKVVLENLYVSYLQEKLGHLFWSYMYRESKNINLELIPDFVRQFFILQDIIEMKDSKFTTCEISKDYLIFLENAKAPRNYYTDIKILKWHLRNRFTRSPCNEESSVSSETDYIRFFNQLGLRGASVNHFVQEKLFQDLEYMQFLGPFQWCEVLLENLYGAYLEQKLGHLYWSYVYTEKKNIDFDQIPCFVKEFFLLQEILK